MNIQVESRNFTAVVFRRFNSRDYRHNILCVLCWVRSKK
jgi:hypothetical protein